MYSEGSGVKKDYFEAVKWLSMSAKQGSAIAQYNLGNMYRNGHGVDQSDSKAMLWHQKSADQGYANAQSQVGSFYARGIGVPKDAVTAVKWYKKAADQGHSESQLALGSRYYVGQGVIKDKIQAYMWINLAAASGLSSAIDYRDRVEKNMTNSQIAKAQKLSGEWISKSNQREINNRDIGVRTPTLRRKILHATGTGFRVAKTGAVITNNHVTENCATIKVNGGSASLRSADSQNDLALLQGTPSPVTAKFRSGRGLRIGDDVIVAGYPLRGLFGGGLNVGTGTVSSLAGLSNDSRKLQISAPVNSGNSGGPLLDNAGRVVGLIVSKVNAVKSAEVLGDVVQGANFAIKAAVAQSFLDMNGVDYQFATNSKKRATADIAEEAKGYTVLIECWK